MEPEEIIKHSGGRAGLHEYGWVKAGYNLDEVESLRQELLARKDVGKVQQALRELGVGVKRDIIQAVKNYNFDSQGLGFIYDNYTAWRRLATGRGTIGDVAYLVHEMTEVEQLQQIQRETGFDFYGPPDLRKLSRAERQRWESDFDRYYRQSHSKALEKEYNFIAKEVNRYIANPKWKLSFLQAAAIDPTRDDEALTYMHFEGVPIKYHHHFDAWSKQADRAVTLSKSVQRKLGYHLPNIMLGDLIGYVKNMPINS